MLSDACRTITECRFNEEQPRARHHRHFAIEEDQSARCMTWRPRCRSTSMRSSGQVDFPTSSWLHSGPLVSIALSCRRNWTASRLRCSMFLTSSTTSSAADGSTGWCAALGSGSNLLGGYLPEGGARRCRRSRPDQRNDVRACRTVGRRRQQVPTDRAVALRQQLPAQCLGRAWCSRRRAGPDDAADDRVRPGRGPARSRRRGTARVCAAQEATMWWPTMCVVDRGPVLHIRRHPVGGRDVVAATASARGAVPDTCHDSARYRQGRALDEIARQIREAATRQGQPRWMIPFLWPLSPKQTASCEQPQQALREPRRAGREPG